ncbi:hypothetical protein ABH940_005551 [Streptacidiphilus sp. BW17]|uniref:hypothetical protein n=1 Tax=Streptacidiphilus sp. BW17 TaxID=3156274 RepID=UPI003518B43E
MDLDLEDLHPTDAATQHTLNRLFDPEGSLWLLREQHQANPHTAQLHEDFFLVLDHASETRGPGAPQLLGVHFERDLAHETIRATMSHHALIPLAQNWLVGRGADPESIREPEGWLTALDATSSEAEQLLRTSGERFEIHDTFSTTAAPFEIWVITTDREPLQAERPVTVFVWRRESDDSTSYTVTQAAFATLDEAYAWTKDTTAPVPAPFSPVSPRAQAARTDGRAAAGPAPEAVALNSHAQDAARRRPPR